MDGRDVSGGDPNAFAAQSFNANASSGLAPWMYRKPEMVGVMLSDSTFRREVSGPGPAFTVKGGRMISTYGVPGATPLPAANEYQVSTFCAFWAANPDEWRLRRDRR